MSSGAQSQAFTDVPSLNPYSDIQQAVAQGWLPAGGAFNPNGLLTRADAAFLVEWLGWTDLASKPSIFANPFFDAAQIPSSQFGDPMIASDFGMIPADNGAFLPTNGMNVADTSIAILHAFRVANGEN